MTIQRALIWAFATEHASLDFAEEQGDNARPGISTVYTILRRGELGCEVDGGGYSLPHPEADIIASAVAHLPQAVGGRRMALLVAECARAGSVPDWRADPPRVEPKGWKGGNQYGRDAETELVGVLRLRSRGRVIEVPSFCCPIRIVPDAETVQAARDSYTAWRRALAWLAADLAPRLSDVPILPGLPPAAPWEAQDSARRTRVTKGA